MNYHMKKTGPVVGSQLTRKTKVTGFSPRITSAAWRDRARRNFILQQGFGDPAPAVRPRQYSALVFQPKVVFVTTVAGIVFQSSGIFAALGAILWMSALFPKLNPFTAVYNLTIGRRAGAFHLRPAPAPRRKQRPEPSR